ncbi:MAG: 1-acyl-sn-glycerol-3-phosphate acyltransferase [Chloroflexota bacterium]
MDAAPLSTPQPDPRDKKTFYFADTFQRRALILLGALGMLPEGKRSQSKGLSVAKTGTARKAIEAHCPIVPITVVGSDKFFAQFPHRTRVHVTLLPPIMPKPDENPLALTGRLMFTLAQALPEEMRGGLCRNPARLRVKSH